MRLVALLLATMLLASCAEAPPTRAADITGEVTRVSEVSGGLQLLVEAVPADTAGSAKAAVRTDGATKWFSEVAGSAPEQGGLGRIRVGVRVSVWFDGPVAMSYPVQAKAGTVLVLTPR